MDVLTILSVLFTAANVLMLVIAYQPGNTHLKGIVKWAWLFWPVAAYMVYRDSGKRWLTDAIPRSHIESELAWLVVFTVFLLVGDAVVIASYKPHPKSKETLLQEKSKEHFKQLARVIDSLSDAPDEFAALDGGTIVSIKDIDAKKGKAK